MLIKNGNRSFTLIEILITVAIIVLLVGGTVASYSLLSAKSKDNRRKVDIENIRAALEMYRSANGVYLTTGQYPTTLTAPVVYISPVPKDPVTNLDYTYTSADGSSYVLTADLSDGTHYQAGPYGASIVP